MIVYINIDINTRLLTYLLFFDKYKNKHIIFLFNLVTPYLYEALSLTYTLIYCDKFARTSISMSTRLLSFVYKLSKQSISTFSNDTTETSPC